MRILVVSPYLPWPLGTGGNAAQFSTLLALSEDHQFTLLCPYNHESKKLHAEILAKKLPKVRVRAVYTGRPRPTLIAHMLGLSKQKLRQWLKGPYPAMGEGTPFYPFDPHSAAFVNAMAEEIDRGIDLFQAEFAETLPLGLAVPSSIPKLFIHHQIHFIYSQRIMQSYGSSPHVNYLYEWMKAQEHLYLRHYDGVIAFSEEDRKIISQLPGIGSVFTSPFPIPADVGIATTLPDKFDGRFIFLGAQEHAPNREALLWLLREIWPKIAAKDPSVRLEVIGPWDESYQKSVKVERVTFAGFVPDLGAALRGGTMLVPLKVGSGIRTKLLASLAQGVPAVTTAVGAEGLLIKDGEQMLIRDEPEAFAEAALQLAREPALWKQLSVAGRDVVAKYYSHEEVRRRRNEIYATLSARSSRRSPAQDAFAPIAS